MPIGPRTTAPYQRGLGLGLGLGGGWYRLRFDLDFGNWSAPSARRLRLPGVGRPKLYK